MIDPRNPREEIYPSLIDSIRYTSTPNDLQVSGAANDDTNRLEENILASEIDNPFQTCEAALQPQSINPPIVAPPTHHEPPSAAAQALDMLAASLTQRQQNFDQPQFSYPSYNPVLPGNTLTHIPPSEVHRPSTLRQMHQFGSGSLSTPMQSQLHSSQPQNISTAAHSSTSIDADGLPTLEVFETLLQADDSDDSEFVESRLFGTMRPRRDVDVDMLDILSEAIPQGSDNTHSTSRQRLTRRMEAAAASSASSSSASSNGSYGNYNRSSSHGAYALPIGAGAFSAVRASGSNDRRGAYRPPPIAHHHHHHHHYNTLPSPLNLTVPSLTPELPPAPRLASLLPPSQVTQ